MANDPRDLIRDVLARVRQRDANFSEEMATIVEAEVRSEWAGERVYIGKRSADLARAAAHQGANLVDLQKRFGIKRRWAYQLMATRKA
jgi:hypothetical protein